MEGRDMDERKEGDRITIMKEGRGAEKEGKEWKGEKWTKGRREIELQ